MMAAVTSRLTLACPEFCRYIHNHFYHTHATGQNAAGPLRLGFCAP
jgi:hypothetical protein